MHDIVVLGAGAMGTAFCFPLADAGHRVALVGTHLDGEWIHALKTSGMHPKLKVPMPENVEYHFHHDLAGCLHRETRVIVLGVSSAGVSWAIDQLKPLIKSPVVILMLTKGLAAENHQLLILPAIVEKAFCDTGLEAFTVAAVAGPCIAAELAARRETSVVIACRQKDVLADLCLMIRTPHYHVTKSTDLMGVEACAALKNFYTLAIGSPGGWIETHGAADAFARVHNPTAGLFTQALHEMAYLVDTMGGDMRTVWGLSGSGDLYVTCQAGRNSRMGRLLGKGLAYSEAKSRYMADDTVEGAELALTIGPTVEKLMERGHLDPARLPLATAVIHAVVKDQPLRIRWKQFYGS